METLKPVEEVVPVKQESSGIPKDSVDAGINMKNAEFLNHLGLNDELFNTNVLEKIDFMASKIEDVESLEDIDMRLGDDGLMPRIDKIYSYLKLIEQAEGMKEKQELISDKIQRYERSN